MPEGQPTQIGRYEVQGELGRGGFGRVYRAYDPTVGRPVAIKILTQVSADTRTRFRNEATVAGNLRHKNIVTVYEYGSFEGLPFLAMEYLEGEDLHHIITSRKALTILEKCNIMAQVADGLHYAHSSGVVHRDMKPANIMLLRDGTVKIMDFGIARLTRTPDATRLTQQGFLIGTLRYMAPEQLAGADFNAQCDIFAYGVIFYELLTGRHPFDAPDAQSLMYKLSFEEPAPIRDFVPRAPDALQQVISRMIQKTRDLRYRNLKDLQFDTEPIRIDLQRGRASELLLQAQELFDKESLEPAQKVLQEALALEPSNRAARTLWESVQDQIQQRTLRPRIEASLSAAEEHLAERRFGDAVQAFESALVLDRENVYIQGRIEQARALVEHSRRASQLLAEARREFEHENLTAAYRIVSEALRHDPKNPEAAEFLKTVQSYVERRQADQRVDDALRKAQGLMLIPAYEEAITVLSALDQKSPKVRELLERVRTEKVAHERKQKLHREMAAATDLLRQHRLEEAAKCLGNLQAEFPENQEVGHLLAYAQKEQAALARTEAVESAAAEVRSRSESRDFDGALAALDRALKKYPGESALIRLLGSTTAAKGAWERQQALQSTLTKCEALRSKQRFAEAVQTVEAALEEHSAEPALLSLLKELETELTRQRRHEAIQKVSKQAEKLLEQAQPESALEMLQQALIRYPGDPALGEILKRALDLVRAKERARAIEAICRDAARHAAAHEFDKALRVLDQGLENWRDDTSLVRQRAATLEAKKSWERQVEQAEIARAAERVSAIAKRGQEAIARADAGDFDGALALLDEALRNWPDATSLHKIRESTLSERERRAKRQRALQELEEIKLLARQESSSEAAELLSMTVSVAAEYPHDAEVQSIAAAPISMLSDVGRARQHMTEGNFRAVLEICERHLAQYPNHVAFGELTREAERGQRRAGLEELQRRAAAEPDLQERARVFEEGLTQYPGEAAIDDELRFTRNKLALVDSIVEKARACERSGRHDEALEKWNSLLTVYNQYPGLMAEIDRVRRDQEKALAEAIERDAQEIEHTLQDGDPTRAAELLRHAQAEHPDAGRLQDLARRIRELGEKRKRARELLAQAQAAGDSGKHDECQTCLRQAFQMDESDAAFRKLVLNRLIDHAQSAVDTDWRQAEALVGEATSLQPGYAAPGAVLRAIADQRMRALEQPAQITEKPAGGDTRRKAPEVEPPIPSHPQVEQAGKQVDSSRNAPAWQNRLLLAACVGALFLAGVIIALFLRTPGETAVTVNANVDGASVSVAGNNCISPNCVLKLIPGRYTLQAARDGYEAVTQQFTITHGQAPFALKLALKPLPQLLQVSTNLEGGAVYLDGRMEGELKDGQYEASDITPGRHTIRVTGGSADFQAEFISAVSAPPEIIHLRPGKDLEATVVANAGAAGSIACNCDTSQLTVDGAAAAQTRASAAVPVTLKGLKEGARQIAVGGRSLVVDIRANPALHVFLTQDRNVGMLIVETAEDGVKVFLNHRLHRRTTEHGLLRIPLNVGKYEVRVEKEGFLTPEPQTLALAKGEEKPVIFALKRALARLEISGALAGAKVRLDGQLLGEIDRNGALQHEVTPGSHAIEVSKDDYEPVRVSEEFRPGKTVRLDRTRLAMSKPAKLPPPQEPKQLDAQDWAQIVNRTNPDDFDSFIRNHPGSAHLEQARSRAAELRQQAQSRAAQQAEQTAWEKTDKNSKEHLQDYLSHFPAGGHVQQARARIDEIDRHAAEALASQRLREQKDQEQARRAADEQAIVKLLKDFEAAYNRKDLPSLQRLWNGIPVSTYRQQFRDSKDLQFRLEITAPPVMNGNGATVICTRTQSFRGQVDGLQTVSERVKLTLSREASGWLIRSIQLN